MTRPLTASGTRGARENTDVTLGRLVVGDHGDNYLVSKVRANLGRIS